MRMMKVVCLGLAGAMVFGASATVSTQKLRNLNRNSTVVVGVSGFATTQELANHTNNLNQTAQAMAQVWNFVFGQSAWFSITNYMHSSPNVESQLSFWEIRDGVTNQVYSVEKEVHYVMGPVLTNMVEKINEVQATVDSQKADKAWSKYQSATGAEAPEGVTVISTPTIMISAGYEWMRYVDVSSNSVWFLQCSGTTMLGADTNNYFKVSDDENKTQFCVKRTKSKELGAIPTDVGFDGNGDFFVKFNVNIQPTIYTAYSLTEEFVAEGNDSNITVTWTQSGGTYTGTVHQQNKSDHLFVHAKYIQPGSVVIENNGTSEFSGGIMINGIKYNLRPKTVAGELVLGLEVQ